MERTCILPRRSSGTLCGTVMTASKICVFCRQDASGAKRAKEHIFPQHLIRQLRVLRNHLSHSPFRTVAGEFSGAQVTAAPAERSLSYIKFVAGSVCRVCNNGWMSSLEGAVMPFISGLAKAELALKALSENDRAALAAWTLKTAIVLSRSVGANQFIVPDKFAAELFASEGKRIPNDVAVFAHISESHDALWSLCPTWVVESSRPDGEESFGKEYDHAFKVFIQLGNLMLVACNWPSMESVYTYETWVSPPLAGAEIAVPVGTDCRQFFPEESAQFMMAIGASLF